MEPEPVRREREWMEPVPAVVMEPLLEEPEPAAVMEPWLEEMG